MVPGDIYTLFVFFSAFVLCFRMKEEDLAEVQRAYQLIGQGKRNFLCGEVPDSVNQFQEAVKIL